MKSLIRNNEMVWESMHPVRTHVSVESIHRKDPNASGAAAKTDQVTGNLVHTGSGTGKDLAEKAERLDLVHM